MTKPKFYACLALLTATFLGATYPVYAVESSPSNIKKIRPFNESNSQPNTTTKFNDLRETLKNNFQDRTAKKCELLTNNIQNRINAYNNKKNAHIKRYENLKNTVSKVITRLEEKGYDVSSLKIALNELDSKIKKFTSDYDIFIEKLENTGNYSCGQSEGEFLNSLEEAKTALQTVLQDAKDIKNYYTEVIKKEISDLREQKPPRSQDNL